MSTGRDDEPGEGPPEGWADEDATSEFAVLSRRFRLMTERALLHHDDLAPAEMLEILKPVVYALVMRGLSSTDYTDREEAVSDLIWKAFEVARAKLFLVDDLLAYVYASLRNRLRDINRGLTQRALRETPYADLRPAHSAVDDGWADAVLDNRKIIRAFDSMKNDALNRRDHISYKMTAVIEMCYHTGCNVAEACAALGLARGETATVSQKIARERSNPNSQLTRLAASIFGDAPIRRILDRRRTKPEERS